MKYVQQILPVLLLVTGLYACQKELTGTVRPYASAIGQSQSLVLSDSVVDKGQPVTATLDSGVTTNGVTWSVKPMDSVQIVSNGQHATFTFAVAGTYTIIARYIVDSTAGTRDSVSASVRIRDSSIQTQPDSIMLAGQNLILVPTSADTGITFVLKTANTFPCYYAFPITQDAYPRGSIIFVGDPVAQNPNGCNGTIQIAGSFTVNSVPPGSTGSFYIYFPSTFGDYLINIANTDSGYVFSKSYLDGDALTISPTTLKH